MSNMKVCPNGHMYDASRDFCPYCPRPDATAATRVDYGSDAATLVETGSGMDKTMIDTGNLPPVRSGKIDPKATMIVSSPDDLSEKEELTAQGKLVGWIACFTWDRNGKSYELREGKTSVGSDSSCDIPVNDPGMSRTHAQFLFRGGKLRVKDSFSTNGTFVNGKDIESDPMVLNDGDVITMNKTSFKLRLVDGGARE